jgi:hypothetical protein
MNCVSKVFVLACALGCGACVDLSGRTCVTIAFSCNQTSITLESPNNAWVAGGYALRLTVDGTASQCTLTIPASLPVGGSVLGTCTANDITWSLAQLCPQPPPVCDASGCGGLASNATCVPGEFQMAVVISPNYGLATPPHVAAEVALDLSVNGKNLLSTTIAPTSVTTEPAGRGCGTCTNASATVSVAGG